MWPLPAVAADWQPAESEAALPPWPASTDPPACPLSPTAAEAPLCPNLKARLAVECHVPHDVPSGNTWPAQWRGEEVKVGRRDGP